MSKVTEEEAPSFCVVRDHEMFYTGLQCIFRDCDQKSRLVCALCLFQKLHNHGQSNDTTFLLKNDQVPLEQKKNKELASIKIKNILEDLRIKINKRLQWFCDSIYNSNLNWIIKNQSITFFQGDCFENIQNLINIVNKFETAFDMCTQKFFDELDLNLMDSNNQLSKCYENQIITKQACCFELLNYSNELKGFPAFDGYQIKMQKNNQDFQNFQHYYKDKTQIIFHQNNLLRIKSSDLEVYNIHTKQLICRKTIRRNSNQQITCVSYNQDNTILFLGYYDGYVYGCNVKKNFDIIFKRKMHSDWIHRLYSLYDEIISVDYSNNLQITNIRNVKQIFKRTLQLNYNIDILNYDFNRGNIIVQCAHHVKIFNRFNHKMIFDWEFDSVRNQLFIQPNFLLLLRYNNLQKFEINYQTNKLMEVKSFKGYSFKSVSSVECGNKFILISEREIYILDQEFDIIQKITLPHFRGDLAYLCRITYIQSMQQIVLVQNGNYDYVNKAIYQFLKIYQVGTKKYSNLQKNGHTQENIYQYQINDIIKFDLSKKQS